MWGPVLSLVSGLKGHFRISVTAQPILHPQVGGRKWKREKGPFCPLLGKFRAGSAGRQTLGQPLGTGRCELSTLSGFCVD